jgi:hypothetical protein
MVSYALTEEAKPLVESVLRAHQDGLLADKRIARDQSRIKQRLSLREQGFCCLGPGQLDC